MFQIVAAIALIVVAGLVVPRQVRMFLAVPFASLQMYLPGLVVVGVPLPVALMAAFALWPEGVRNGLRLLKWKPTTALFGILAAYLLSLSWSPDPRLGLTVISYLLAFMLVLSAAMDMKREQLMRLLRWTAWLGLAEAVLVVIFRFEPELKMLFLHTPVASLFISRNLLGVLFTTAQNNVLDPSKSGGFFTNANVAAAYMGVISMAWLALRITGSKDARLPLFIPIAYLLAIWTTGSKAGVLLSVTSVMVFVWLARGYSVTVRKWTTVFGVFVPIIVGLVYAVYFIAYMGAADVGTFKSHADSTFLIRTKIWGYAVKSFPHHALLGQGFGGWQKGFPGYAYAHGIPPSFPPHDTFIYLWSQGGLFAAVLGLVFAVGLMSYLWRHMRVSGATSSSDALVYLAGFMAFGWTFVHGLGENFGLVGEAHMAPFLAVMLALIYRTRLLQRQMVERPEKSFSDGVMA